MACRDVRVWCPDGHVHVMHPGVHVARSRCPRRPRRQRPHAGPLHTFSTWKMAPAVPTASPGPCAPSVPCCSRQGQSQAAQEKVPCRQGRCREARALHGSIYRKFKPVTASVACAGRARRPASLLPDSVPFLGPVGQSYKVGAYVLPRFTPLSRSWFYYTHFENE